MTLQNPRDFTVQIRNGTTNQVVGTGIVVAPNYIVTCSHVMLAAGVSPRIGKIPGYWKISDR
jgi:hypothetical protein